MRGAAEGPRYDFAGEQLHWEGTPHRGDLVTNLALGATLLWLPLTAAAVGRGAFMKFRFTDKRVSVITSAPWKSARPARVTCTSVPCALEKAHCANKRLSTQSALITANVHHVPACEHGCGTGRLLRPQLEGWGAAAGGRLYYPGPQRQAPCIGMLHARCMR